MCESLIFEIIILYILVKCVKIVESNLYYKLFSLQILCTDFQPNNKSFVIVLDNQLLKSI